MRFRNRPERGCMPAWVPQRAHRAGGKRNAHSCSLPLLPLQTVVPSFNLYRGLYELSQYAFLADRTGSAGLTWASLSADPGCGMASVLVNCALEALFFIQLAYYSEQVCVRRVAGCSGGVL